MQSARYRLPIALLLIVMALLTGGMMFMAKDTQAAPAAQESDDDTTASEIYLPLILAADASISNVPLSPDSYVSDSEEAPEVTEDQVQSSTYCWTYIKFINSSSQTIKIYWKNSYGQEQLYKTLSSGYYYWQQTYYGYAWRVRDTSGNLLKSFTVNSCSYVYVTIDNNDFPQPTATPTSPSGGACYTEIIAKQSNKCMDVSGWSTANNAQIQQWSCSGGDNQQWFFSPVPGKADTYLIRSKYSGKAVDVLYGSTSAGKDLVQYSADGSSSQQWKIINISGDIYELRNINSGLVADVEGGSTSDGAHIIQWPDNNTNNQRWKIPSCLGQQPTPTNTPAPPTPTNTPVPPTPTKTSVPPTPTKTSVPPTPTKTPTTAPQLGSIGDRVWNDFDRDGIQDAGEPGVPNVTMQLKDCSGNVTTTTTTNGSGIYTFGGLTAGCYAIGIVTPSGFQLSPKAQGTDGNLDSDINIGNAMSDNINLGAGQNITYIDAGINQPAAPTATPTATPAPQLGALGDRVWRDTNGNGIQDAGEPGVSGVSVQLLDCSGNLRGTDTTDANGIYTFSGLAAGCYVVRFVNIDSNLFAFSPANQTGEASDSDVEFLDSVTPGIVNGQTANINLAAGEINNDVDAGLVPQGGGDKACIGDYVWSDMDYDGIQDSTEMGVMGAGVYVGIDSTGDNVIDLYVDDTTTDSHGYYLICGLEPNTPYIVEFAPPMGCLSSTTPNAGNDDTVDSDHINNYVYDVVLTAGTTDDTIDAGYRCNGD